MKKRAITLMLALVMCLSLCSPVMAEETNFDNSEFTKRREISFEGSDVYVFVDPELVAAPKTKSNGVYSHSTYTYVKKDLLRQDSLEHSEVTQLVTVARGQSILTSKSVTVSGLISFEGSVSAELKQAIAAKTKMNANLGWTATTEVSTEFRFPDGMPGDYAVFYMAIAYDYYGFTYHRYDHYIGNGAGGGLGVGNIVKDAGEVTFYAHIPYDITYPRTFFA